jgi:hypothetical protein
MRKTYLDQIPKVLFTLMLVLAGLLSQAQSNPVKAENASSENLKSKYLVKTEIIRANVWGYIISENGKIIFRSSESNVFPNIFNSEKDALEAADVKIKHLEAKK